MKAAAAEIAEEIDQPRCHHTGASTGVARARLRKDDAMRTRVKISRSAIDPRINRKILYVVIATDRISLERLK
jgi:hypothetical protein